MARPVTLVIGFLFIVISVLAQHAVHSCGERVLQRRGLLIGGKYSTRGMWPWQVGIYKNLNGWTFICGGALVAPQWVLTAAHCFYAERNNPIKTRFKKDIKPVTKYKVRAGDHEININEDSEQERFPLEILVHPGYRHDPNYENDIALIKLDQNVTLGDYVRTVCLPGTTQDLTMPGAVGTIAGWGVTESSWRSSSLRHSGYTILNNSACDKSSKHFFNQTVTFCARDIKLGVACYGDSGGSMVRKAVVHGQHRWTTIGLVSWGGCTLTNNYVYYTKLQPFVDWILHKTISCANVGHPINGLRKPDKKKYFSGETVTFECITSHTRLGKSSLSCQSDGTWSGLKPRCLECPFPLGMENKAIPDTRIRASSYKDLDHRPRYGRLHGPRAWCSRREWKPYLEIDLGKPYRITCLATQGSARDNQWVTEYMVTHTRARTSFVVYRENGREKIFKGNRDATSIVKHKVKDPFIAKRVRFYSPTGFLLQRACMRVEIYGFDPPTDCVMVGSRVLGKWGSSNSGLDYYYKAAYVKAVSGNYAELELENREHGSQYFKVLPKTSIVLGVPPEQEDLQIGTRVLAPWAERYYLGKITQKRGKLHYVRIDDNDKKWFTIDKLRRLTQNETFCK